MKIVLCMLLLLASTASAGDLTLRWTNPKFGAAPTDTVTGECCGEDTTFTLNSFVGVDVYGYRFTAPQDTLYFGRAPGVAGASDSVTLSIDPGSMGCILLWANNGKRSTCYASYLFAIPLDTPPPPPDPGAGLVGTYWRGSKNNSFNALLATRIDSTVNFDWGLGPPMQGVPSDSFCVRWDGYLNVPTDGAYTLYVRSSEGCRLWIDGVPVIDQWIYSFAQTFDGAITLTKGKHAIRIDYFEDVGDASCVFSWSGPTIPTRSVVPAAALSH